MIPPQDQVAAMYMAHKGFPGIEPYDVDKIEGGYCWYYMYELPEGVVELEVFWDGKEWQTTVTTFTSKDEQRASAG